MPTDVSTRPRISNVVNALSKKRKKSTNDQGKWERRRSSVSKKDKQIELNLTKWKDYAKQCATQIDFELDESDKWKHYAKEVIEEEETVEEVKYEDPNSFNNKYILETTIEEKKEENDTQILEVSDELNTGVKNADNESNNKDELSKNCEASNIVTNEDTPNLKQTEEKDEVIEISSTVENAEAKEIIEIPNGVDNDEAEISNREDIDEAIEDITLSKGVNNDEIKEITETSNVVDNDEPKNLINEAAPDNLEMNNKTESTDLTEDVNSENVSNNENIDVNDNKSADEEPDTENTQEIEVIVEETQPVFNEEIEKEEEEQEEEEEDTLESLEESILNDIEQLQMSKFSVDRKKSVDVDNLIAELNFDD